MTPTVDEIRRSVDAIDLAISGLIRFAEEGEIRHWYKATGLLQDALAELGYDITPMKEQPPATPEAIYDDAAYFEGRQR